MQIMNPSSTLPSSYHAAGLVRVSHLAPLQAIPVSCLPQNYPEPHAR